uniref:dnaJ homolog subfamily C member 17 isoform X2 n=1 Tax=Myxine glutinosa TaxID=7769 RepID=UPI00358FA413
MATKEAKEILNQDLYAMLGIGEQATAKEVKTAYRQRALRCHPDKNPDNARAAELFHELSQALEVLTDAAARAAYDMVRRAKKLTAERTLKLDDRRKKSRLDLEAREHAAETEMEQAATATRRLKEEIMRLREEGSRQLHEEQRLIKEQLQRQTQPGYSSANIKSDVTPKLKLKWKSRSNDESNGGYSQEVIMHIFQKYGELLNVLVSDSRKGSALLEFATTRSAELAVINERGLTTNPLTVRWLDGKRREQSDGGNRNEAETHSRQPGDALVRS